MHTFLLYALSFLGSGLGFVTQSLVSGFWTTTYSDDVFHFSVNTAVYFLSLGVGSLLSSRWRNPSPQILMGITILLCLWTGLSITFLKFGIRYFENMLFLPVFAVAVSGTLAGHIIPLTLRMRRDGARMTLSSLFFFDYCAAILFTLLFTFVLLIPLGYGKTSLSLSYSCLALCFGLMLMGRLFSPLNLVTLGLAAALPYPLYQKVTTQDSAPKMRLDSSDAALIVYKEQSHYQKIVLTEERGEDPLFPGIPQHILYLDGFVQFSSVEEQNYHACIANVPLAATEYGGHPARTALVLGGGDGLVARNLLGNSKIKKITQVELDPAMIHLAQNELKVRMYNLDSLRNPKVDIVIQDAFYWIRHAKESYDVIVIDFPAPKNITLSRLFSSEFYRAVMRHLNPNGVVALQAGPSFSTEDRTSKTLSKVTTCIKKTFASLGFPSYVYVNPKDQEAFLLVPGSPSFDTIGFFKKMGMYGSKESSHLCLHSPAWKEPKVEVNTLNTLTLSTYMLDWFTTVGGPFFHYRGNHAVFLPD